MLRARSLPSRVSVLFSCADLDWISMGWFGLNRIPFLGGPAFPFIGQAKARVTAEEKEKNERERKASRVAVSFFSYMRVPPILYMLSGTALCHGPVHHWRHAHASSAGIAFHSDPVDVVVN